MNEACGLERSGSGTVCGCFTRRCSMAGWEEELAVLLRELGVKQEEPDEVHLRPLRKPMRSDVKRREPYADAQPWSGEANREEDEAWQQDLTSVRREVDSIVNQVILLMRR